MSTALPYAVTEYANRSGSASYRVSGYWQGKRLRKNFRDLGKAETFCNDKNAEAMAAVPVRAPMQLVEAWMNPAQIRDAQWGLEEINDRWPFRDVITAGIAAMKSKLPPAAVAPLALEWLALMEGTVSPRWHSDLKHRVTAFTESHPGLDTHGLTRAVVRAWLDGLPHAQQSKANMRNAVHRFGGWLVERGYVRENPAAEIRISRRRSGAQLADRPLPSIFTPIQCEALLRACEMGACRRLLGWMATCLFTGLRPDSEAPRATWAEVNLDTAEWSVMGRKRGAKPRVIPLTPAALAWLRVVKADKMERPALYSRAAKIRAIELANEWLTENHPDAPKIAWSNDVTRHTFASYRSPHVAVHKLAEELGNSAATIYGHYRHPRPSAEVKAFWAILPANG